MLGDVLLIGEKHTRAAEVIYQRILATRKEKMIIAISGESGSGKTELAHVLAKMLKNDGIKAKPIHIDNYYKTLPEERTDWRLLHGVENCVGYQEYDWDTICKNIEDFKTGSKSTMPCIDLVTDQVDTLITDFSKVDMLIIDGLYAIKTESSDLNIFIELTYNETGKAQKLRGKEPQNEYRRQVLMQEHKVVQSLKSRATLFVNKNYVVSEEPDTAE